MTARPPRLLRHARQSTGALAANSAFQLAQKHALCHYASNTIYSFIPKNACTTLRYSLGLANGVLADGNDLGWVHQNNATFSASLRDLATADYTFVVLRCPFARLASAFLDKIVDKMHPVWAMRHALNDVFDPDQITFRQFVGYLLASPGPTSNIHWRPQTHFMVYEQYDDYFRMEDFGTAVATLQARAGLTVHDTRALMRHDTSHLALDDSRSFAAMPAYKIAAMKRAGTCPSHRALYDDGSIAKARKMYDADIALYAELFGQGSMLFA